MNKSIAVKSIKYPKLIRKRDPNKTFGLSEPLRKNMYDVILESFEIADRKTFLHRLITIGEHSFGKDDEIVDLFDDSVKEANSAFHYERVTGLLLYYSKHFIHMVEGDEDSIHQQLQALYRHKLFHRLGTMKVLIHLSHIKERFIPDWAEYSGNPAKLLGEIKLDCSIHDSGRHVYTCIRKFYNFVLQYVTDFYYQTDAYNGSLKGHHGEDSDVLADNMRSELPTRGSQTSLRSSMVVVNKEPYRVNLPETELLDFILKSEHTQRLDAYCLLYGVVPQRDIYKDKVWPIPSDFIPYDIFLNPYNLVMDLNKGRRTQSEKEEIGSVSQVGSSNESQDDICPEGTKISIVTPK